MTSSTAVPSETLIRIPEALLRQMSELVDAQDRDEMALPSYLHKNPALRWMAWRRLEVMAAELHRIRHAQPPDENVSIVDFGCGTGALLPTAAGQADIVYGIDPVLAPARLAVDALGLDRVTLLDPDAARDAIEPGSVAVILAGEVLEHIQPLAPVLEFFERILAPGGALLASLPTESALYRFGRKLAGFSGHYHHSDAEHIHLQVESAGFRTRKLRQLPARSPLAIYWVIEYGI
jgi:2-polyprenyl-3-methyl-5-hydroxy-6-metoxy-1,4-benzoquinol methylase